MATLKTLTENTINAIAAAVFAKPEPFVVEAYSALGEEPLFFRSPQELANHVKRRLSAPNGHAYFFVVYPDMLGIPVQEKIVLNAESPYEGQVRFTWSGWGLISVQLFSGDNVGMSRITANSSNRAAKWASTYPKLSPLTRGIGKPLSVMSAGCNEYSRVQVKQPDRILSAHVRR